MAQKALLPLFPLDLVLLPGETLPLHIFEMRYRKMVRECHADGSEFGIVRSTGNKVERVGCTAKVREITKRFDDGRFNVRVVGSRRFIVHTIDSSEDCLHAAIEYFADEDPKQASASEVADLLDLAGEVRRLAGTQSSRWEPNHPWLSFKIAAGLPVSKDLKQELLTTVSEVDRVELVTGYLQQVIRKRGRRERQDRLARGNGRLRN